MFQPSQREITSLITSGCCTLFVGAGLSMGSNLPGWQELTEYLRRDLGCSHEYDFPKLAQAYEKLRSRKALISRVCELTDRKSKGPTTVHRLLPHLGIQTWITTNYDDLLEVTLGESGQPPCIVIKDEDLAHRSQRVLRLVKLHGDRRCPDSILITKNDLFAVRQKRPLLWGFLMNELVQSSILFLGYSMRDPDFNQIQAELLHLLGPGHLRRSYAAMFDGDEIQKADCDTRNISIIDLGPRKGDPDDTDTLAGFLEPIVNLVKQSPRIPREPHDAVEAAKLVPAEIQAQLQEQGYHLICCLEYRTYCAVFDEREFLPVPAGWEPFLPPAYRGSEYLCIQYGRVDEARTNIWKGWAIGKK